MKDVSIARATTSASAVISTTAENIPCGGENDELQHRVRRGKEVIVGDELARPGEHESVRECDGGEHPVGHRPSNPEGLNASAASSNPNETAGAHDGPKKVDVNDSASPSTK